METPKNPLPQRSVRRAAGPDHRAPLSEPDVLDPQTPDAYEEHPNRYALHLGIAALDLGASDAYLDDAHGRERAIPPANPGMLALAGWSHPALAATEFLRFETAVARASRQTASLETGSEGRPESMPSTSQLHTWYRAIGH